MPGHFHADFTRRTGIALLDGYGSTETNFVIGSPIAECKPGTMGRLFEGFQARVVDDDSALLEALMPKGYRARPEQVIVFKIAAWDTNCPQHIPQKFDAADVAAALAARDARIAELEAEVAALKGQPTSAS